MTKSGHINLCKLSWSTNELLLRFSSANLMRFTFRDEECHFLLEFIFYY